MGVEIFLFGRFEVRCNGEPLAPRAWKNAKTQALFKILVGERGRLFSVDELLEYLWPAEELNLQSAASNLRNRVAELRKILEPDLARGESSRYIHTRSEGYLFNAEADCWLDSEECTRCETAGRRAQREGRLDDAIAYFEQAVTLYRGDYLAEDRYAEWALQLQERWRERYVEILSELAEGLAQRGRYREAIRSIERAVEKSPLHETLYRQWMVYAHCAGEAAQARRAYQRCREVLERELGERPSSRTEEIYKQIQQGQLPEIAGRYPVIAEKSLRPSLKLHRLPFCGRRSEWQRLSSALEKAQEGQGVLVLISGEPGVGKTRLCEEFFMQAQEKLQAQMLMGRCLELKNPLPLHPWLEALHPAVSGLTPEGLGHLQRSWLAECAELLPALRSTIPQLPQNVALPSEHRPYRLFETLSQILRALARQRAPLLVFLDDLQWVDEETVDLLCYLMDKWTALPLMILATLRSGERAGESLLATLKDHALRRRWLEELHLKRLTASDIQEMITQFSDKTTSDVGERLYRESAGNPLFLSAILQSCFENGLFVTEGAHWRLSLPAEIQLPAQVLQLIEHRTARVGPAAQRVLQLVACAVQIELEVLEQAWEGTTEELFAHLNDLMAQGILTERQGRYEFAHDKFREVIYGALEGPRKIWLHRRLAQALESLYADPTAAGLGARLAEHYERGGQPQKALERVLKTIEVCRKQYREEEGLHLAERGLSLLRHLEDRLPREELWKKEFFLYEARAELHLHTGKLNETETDLVKLDLIAIRLQDQRRQAQVRLLEAQRSEDKDQPEESLRNAQQALQIYNSLNDPRGQAISLQQLARAYYWLRNYAKAIETSQKACPLAEEIHDTALLAKILDVLGSAHSELGENAKALDCLQRALKFSIEAHDRKTESDLLNDLAAIYWQLSDFQNSLSLFQRALAVSSEIGNRLGTGMTLASLGSLFNGIGQYANALQVLQEASSIFASLGNSVESARVQRQLAYSLSALGDHQQAIATLQEAHRLCTETDDAVGTAESLRLFGEIYYASGQISEGLSCIKTALKTERASISTLFSARCQTALSKLYLRQDHPKQAVKASEEALQYLKTSESPHMALEAYYRRYQALKALGSPQAADSLHTAQTMLLGIANRITDASLRESFLKIPLHQEILNAARAANLSPNAA